MSAGVTDSACCWKEENSHIKHLFTIHSCATGIFLVALLTALSPRMLSAFREHLNAAHTHTDCLHVDSSPHVQIFETLTSEHDQPGLSPTVCLLLPVLLKGRSWIVKRSYEDFRVLDKHLHLCIYDRRFSQLPELPRLDSLTDQSEVRLWAFEDC